DDLEVIEAVGAEDVDAWGERALQRVLLVETGAAGPARVLGASATGPPGDGRGAGEGGGRGVGGRRGPAPAGPAVRCRRHAGGWGGWRGRAHTGRRPGHRAAPSAVPAHARRARRTP